MTLSSHLDFVLSVTKRQHRQRVRLSLCRFVLFVYLGNPTIYCMTPKLRYKMQLSDVV